MSAERLFLVDPYNNEHIQLLKDFEEENNIQIRMSDQLEELRSSITAKEYSSQKREKNEIEENICIEKDSKILDICHLHVEKDIKIGRMNLAPVKEHNKKLLSFVKEYAFDVLNIEELFLETDKKDKSIISYLESHGYEDLGDEKGKTIYLIEREEEKRIQRMMS